MVVIRPAASPQEFDMLIIAEDMVVLMSKLLWIAGIQFLGLAQFE